MEGRTKSGTTLNCQHSGKIPLICGSQIRPNNEVPLLDPEPVTKAEIRFVNGLARCVFGCHADIEVPTVTERAVEVN